MRKTPLIPQDAAVTALSDGIGLRVGRGRRFSYASLSEATGISERTLDSYGRGDATPSLANFLALCSVLGPGFTSDVLAVSGPSAKQGTTDEPEHMRILCALGNLTAQVADAVKDGHVDHREAAALRPQAQALLDMLEPLARDTSLVPIRGAVS